MCDGPAAGSTACSFCTTINAKLATAITQATAEATACRRQGDTSPHYTAPGQKRKQSALLRSAFGTLLGAQAMCSIAAEALLPGTANQFFTLANVDEHGGAWVCETSAAADMLCGSGSDGDSSDVNVQQPVSGAAYPPTGTGGNSSMHTSSNNNTNNSSTNSTMAASSARNCAICGGYVDQFAARVRAGKANITRAAIAEFCIEQQVREYTAGIAAGAPDELVEDSCEQRYSQYQWCDVQVSSRRLVPRCVHHPSWCW